MHTKRKGYRVERKIRLLFQRFGWNVIRAGSSLGESDLVCLRNRKCILLQIKSTKRQTFYYYGYRQPLFEGFPFFLVVDFGYNKIRVVTPKPKVTTSDGQNLEEFLKSY